MEGGASASRHRYVVSTILNPLCSIPSHLLTSRLLLARNSHPSASSNPDHRVHPPPYPSHLQRDTYRDPSAPPMATTTILASGASYQTQQPYAPAYPHPPGPSISNMISPTEPRKPVDGNDTLNRQSLPSLSEVISGAKPGQLPPPGPPGPPTMQAGSGLPSPFVPAQRHYPEADKHSPQSIHPTASFSRPEHPSTFTDSPRVPFNGRPGLPPVSDRRPSPPTKHELPPHHLHESQKAAEPHHANGGYSHPPPPAASYPPSQLPPGQVPLPAYPISPGHAVHHINGPYDPRASGVHPEEHDYQSRARYDANGNRHFEAWSYQDTLGRVRMKAKLPPK